MENSEEKTFKATQEQYRACVERRKKALKAWESEPEGSSRRIELWQKYLQATDAFMGALLEVNAAAKKIKAEINQFLND